jgi:predicted GNAT family acetyltransferase
MQFDIKNNTDVSRLEAVFPAGIAHLDYRIECSRMLVLYVEVPPALRGQGIGGQLAAAAIAMAKRGGYELVPICSFMASYIRERAGR